MRIVFMGTPDFSVPVLECLAESEHEVVLAVSQPDKPKGRGKELQPTPVKKKALEYHIPVLQPEKVKEQQVVEALRKIQPDCIVVVAFGQILSKEILDLPKYGCLNIHASLLPKYRGAAPIQWAVIDGLKETGITIMQMDEGLDTGDILEQLTVPLAPDETGGSLFDKLSELGGSLLLETLKKIEERTISPVKQDNSASSYAKMLDRSLGNIDFSKPAKEIERLIRGLNPWPSAYTFYQGKMLKIWRAQVMEENEAQREHMPVGKESYQAGEIIGVDKDTIYVQTGKGILQIWEVQLEGKKRMDTASFLRGMKVEASEILQRNR